MSPPLPRLVASDLDGTLLDPSGTINDRTREALTRAHQAGSVVVAATGRSHLSASERVADAGVIDWIVCSNGASLYRVADATLVDVRTMSVGEVAAAVTAVRRVAPDAGFAWERTGATDHAAGFGHDRAFVGVVPNAELVQRATGGEATVESIDRPAVKLLVVVPGTRGAGVEEIIGPVLPESVGVISSGAAFAEVTAAGVDKAAGLARLCQRLDLDPSDSVAFGDQPNDIAMLSWAGIGVAMAHADARVLAVADEVTDTNADDGVARWIERRLG